MAPPPKHVITRRLVKRYFKRFMPMVADNSQQFLGQVMDCFKKHGLDSEKCADLVEQASKAKRRAFHARNQLRKLNVRSEVMQTLRKPIYPSQRKGRYRDLPFRERDIYDGIL